MDCLTIRFITPGLEAGIRHLDSQQREKPAHPLLVWNTHIGWTRGEIHPALPSAVTDAHRDGSKQSEQSRKAAFRLDLEIQKDVKAANQPRGKPRDPTHLLQSRLPSAPEDRVFPRRDEFVDIRAMTPQATRELVAENDDPRLWFRVPQCTDERDCSQTVRVTALRNNDKPSATVHVRNTSSRPGPNARSARTARGESRSASRFTMAVSAAGKSGRRLPETAPCSRRTASITALWRSCWR